MKFLFHQYELLVHSLSISYSFSKYYHRSSSHPQQMYRFDEVKDGVVCVDVLAAHVYELIVFLIIRRCV
jgi:hypothetical protein